MMSASAEASGSKGTFVVSTLGCKANAADSFALEERFREAGWEAGGPEADPGQVTLCVVNSCTVTDEADRQSRAQLRRLRKKFPRARLVYTGCGAETLSAEGLDAGSHAWIVGNQDKPRITDLLAAAQGAGAPGGRLGRVLPYGELLSRHPMDREWPGADALLRSDAHSRTRAFVKIQEGCDAFCTYCVIPYGRGPSRSVDPGTVVSELRRVIDSGVREAVLTGTNLGDYEAGGRRGPRALADLVELLLAETSIERLRLSSLDPCEILESGLIERVGRSGGRLCPHFHVSLQAATSRVLRLMKRKYGVSEAERCLREIAAAGERLRQGFYVGMDVITGFPGERAEDFEEGLERLRRLPWTRLHVFPYSERAGTPATRLEGRVPRSEREERAQALGALSLERQRAWHESRIGRVDEVLFERPERTGRFLVGHSRDYARTLLPVSALEGRDPAELRNQALPVRAIAVIADGSAQEVSALGEFP